MKFVYPDIDCVFCTDSDKVNTIIVENRKLFRELVEDLAAQTAGYDGKAIVSKNDAPIDFSKNAELLSVFAPFDLNQKSLINKIVAALEKEAAASGNLSATAALLASAENYLDDLVNPFDCELSYPKLSPSSIIKAAGIYIESDGQRLEDRIYEYMNLVREFDRDKLFITVNLRSYLEDERMESFLETIINHNFHLVMIENFGYNKLKHEQRLTVDDSLCIF